MTKRDFEDLQLKFNSSGMTLKSFLHQEGVAYSTYMPRQSNSRVGVNGYAPEKYPNERICPGIITIFCDNIAVFTIFGLFSDRKRLKPAAP